MTKTVEALMDCGFRVVYGFTESDEISLLFAPEDNAFGRKVRKYMTLENVKVVGPEDVVDKMKKQILEQYDMYFGRENL